MTHEEIAEVWQGPVRALARRKHKKYPTIEIEDIEGEAWLWVYSQGNPHLGLRGALGKRLNQYCAQELEARRRADLPNPAEIRWTESEFRILLSIALRPEVAADAHEGWRPVLERLAEIVGDLPLGDQELLVGKYAQDASGARLARDSGVSEMTISRRLRSLVERVQDALEGDGEDREYVGQTTTNSFGTPVPRRHGKAKVE